MLKAYKPQILSAYLYQHVTYRVRQSFAGVRIMGLAPVLQAVSQGPVLFIAAHSAFWDALVIAWLSQNILQADAYAWMDANNLKRLPFFRWLGAFGVYRHPADVLAAMRYATQLLHGPKRVVWIFPQGMERPLSIRPLGFLGGSAVLARRSPTATVIPVVMRYEHGQAPKPWLHVAFGEPVLAHHSKQTHEQAVISLLAQQDADICAEPKSAADYQQVWSTRELPGNEPWSTRFLAWVARCLPF